jgi:hypothetical protein
MKKILGLSGSLSTNFNYLKMVISDPERKGLLQMCWEFLKCSVARRCIAVHYLTSFLYRRDVRNIYDYISKGEADAVQEKINNPILTDLINNKLSFVEHFGRGGFPVPRLLGYNILEKMYLRGVDTWKVVDLSSPQDLKDSLDHLMALWGIEGVFLKHIRGTNGKGAFRVELTQLHKTLEIERIHSAVSKNSYVLQQAVVQHAEMSRLNPSSVNTMRIDTFRAPGSQAEILSALLRVGGKDNCVDAVGAGGVFVGIHLDSGKLKETARNFFHGSKMFGTFKANPANGIVFEGFQVPLFDEVKRTVIQAAGWIPPALVGWDVAVGPSGPVLIEANVLYYGLTMSDIAYGGYRKNPVFQKVMAYANEKRK